MILLSYIGLKSIGIEVEVTSEDGTEAEGKDVRVFVDTGENVNTMSRRQFIAYLDANLE